MWGTVLSPLQASHHLILRYSLMKWYSYSFPFYKHGHRLRGVENVLRSHTWTEVESRLDSGSLTPALCSWVNLLAFKFWLARILNRLWVCHTALMHMCTVKLLFELESVRWLSPCFLRWAQQAHCSVQLQWAPPTYSLCRGHGHYVCLGLGLEDYQRLSYLPDDDVCVHLWCFLKLKVYTWVYTTEYELHQTSGLVLKYSL